MLFLLHLNEGEWGLRKDIRGMQPNILKAPAVRMALFVCLSVVLLNLSNSPIKLMKQKRLLSQSWF